MNPLLLDIILYLQALNLVQGDGIDSYRDFCPSTPDDCLYLMEYTGKVHNYGNFGVRNVQFNYRSIKATTARTKCMSIFKLFGEREDESKIQLTTDRWAIICCDSTPFKSSVDEQGRTSYTFNARIYTYFE